MRRRATLSKINKSTKNHGVMGICKGKEIKNKRGIFQYLMVILSIHVLLNVSPPHLPISAIVSAPPQAR